MKKLFIPMAILLVSILLIAGCSSTTTTSPQQSSTSPPVTSTAQTSTVPIKPITSAPPTNIVTTPVGSNKYGGTLRWIEPNAPSAPIGAVCNSAQQICLEPVLIEYADASLAPGLASYEVNTDPDNPSITFHINKGIKFHDGTDFNAEALSWDIQKLIDSKLFASVRSR